MKKIAVFLALGLSTIAFSSNKICMSKLIENTMQCVEKHTFNMAESLKQDSMLLPKTIDKNGKLLTSDSRWWCSGFFPGVLWYTYEYNQKPETRKWAEIYTGRVEREKYTTDNHDVGFMLYCSFGNGYRLTKNEKYVEVLVTGAKSLSTRYNPKLEVIRSWDFNKEAWQYPVIIDNMMNLELLLFATKQTGDSSFYKISISHTNKTIENHFRSDFSSYHLVSYDTISGIPHKKQTVQGYSDSSSWARGQGWGLYGFTYMYGQTKEKKYLHQAINIANYIVNHPNLPKDKIPYWDFNAPNIPNELRDASAGALIASALIELSQYVGNSLSKKYIKVAETQLRTLASPEYLAQPGTNGNFILKHSVGFHKKNEEVDVPLTYTDYYFVEALLRYKKIVLKTQTK